MKRILLVTCACLHCGRGEEKEYDDLHQLPPSQPRCSACGGPVLAADAEYTRVPGPPPSSDWDAERPKRGRPKKNRLTAPPAVMQERNS